MKRLFLLMVVALTVLALAHYMAVQHARQLDWPSSPYGDSGPRQ